MDAAEISAHLHGRASGRNQYLVRCPCLLHGKGHGDKNPSLSISDGDDGRLFVHCFAGCSYEEIITALDRLGWLDERQRLLHGLVNGPSNRRGPHEKLSRPPSRIKRWPKNENDTAQKSRYALQLWNASFDPRDTIVVKYLASRGLTLTDEIAGDVIRFHPALKFDGAFYGAMVALFRDIRTNAPCGIHRTFLDKTSRKLGRKMLGRSGGAAIKLDADENVTRGLFTGEGFETCLAAQLMGLRPVWALGSANAIATFPVLSEIEAITLLGEVNDGGANHRAVQACAARWHKAGCETWIVKSRFGDDLNDIWRAVMS